ncbi:MAG: hypothetical protein HOA14_12030, partial [Planctomycetaceae bacterium]|nr:hypothetical protein [Planctomycetaceae bacterium]
MIDGIKLRQGLICTIAGILGLIASELLAQTVPQQVPIYPKGYPTARPLQNQPNPRVANLPRGRNPQTAQYPQRRRQQLPQTPKLFKPTTVLATVGSEYIMAGDLLPQVEMVMWNFIQDIPPAELTKYRDDIARQKEILLTTLLQQAIDAKVLYVAFRKSLKQDELKTLDERIDSVSAAAFDGALEEMLPRVKAADKKELKQLRQEDMHLAQLSILMVADDAETMHELDQILRRFGSSYEMEKMRFAEVNFGRQLIVQNVNLQEEITHRQMLDYYNKNIADYQFNTKARWQQLSVLSKNHPQQEAYRLVCEMGNRVLNGAPFDEIAKQWSEDLKATNGGNYDWVEPGNLVSKPLDQ